MEQMKSEIPGEGPSEAGGPAPRVPPTMRAKMRVAYVQQHEGCEVLQLNAVGPKGSYPPDGSDEDNTYAKFSPSGSLSLTVANPALLGKFAPGDTFYLDFTPAA